HAGWAGGVRGPCAAPARVPTSSVASRPPALRRAQDTIRATALSRESCRVCRIEPPKMQKWMLSYTFIHLHLHHMHESYDSTHQARARASPPPPPPSARPPRRPPPH